MAWVRRLRGLGGRWLVWSAERAERSGRWESRGLQLWRGCVAEGEGGKGSGRAVAAGGALGRLHERGQKRTACPRWLPTPPAHRPASADGWWPFGEDARQRYRGLRHAAIVPHEQLLAAEALALAAAQRQRQQQQQEVKQEEGGKAEEASGEEEEEQQQQQPSQQPGTQQQQADTAQRERAAEASAPEALAHTFVGRMRRLNHCRAALEAAGALPLAACPAGSAAAQQSLHCTECQQSVFAASAVLAPVGPPSAWRHVCLECAAAAAAAEPAADGEQQQPQPGGAAGGPVLLFVKPCWAELEACARQLERGLADLAGARAGKPLAASCPLRCRASVAAAAAGGGGQEKRSASLPSAPAPP